MKEAYIGVSQWEAVGLKLGTEYTLSVRNLQGRVLDQRVFMALDTDHSSPKIAVVSCSDDKYEKEQKKFGRVGGTEAGYDFHDRR